MDVARWEKRTEWPLTVAALVFLVAYAVPIVASLSDLGALVCEVLVWVTWVAFVVDFGVRVYLAPRRGHYVLRHWLDVLVIALPVLRPLRLLRLVAVLKALNRRAATGLRGRVAVYVGGGSALLALCGALAVLDVERNVPGANIHSFGDALWWAATTMTTVGYGDRYPVTLEGRGVAVALMVGGIALLGVVTASLASWLIESVNAVERAQTRDLVEEIDVLHAKLDRLLEAQGLSTAFPTTPVTTVGVATVGAEGLEPPTPCL